MHIEMRLHVNSGVSDHGLWRSVPKERTTGSEIAYRQRSLILTRMLFLSQLEARRVACGGLWATALTTVARSPRFDLGSSVDPGRLWDDQESVRTERSTGHLLYPDHGAGAQH